MTDKPRLNPKPPRDDPGRRPSQTLAREALIGGTQGAGEEHTALAQPGVSSGL